MIRARMLPKVLLGLDGGVLCHPLRASQQLYSAARETTQRTARTGARTGSQRGLPEERPVEVGADGHDAEEGLLQGILRLFPARRRAAATPCTRCIAGANESARITLGEGTAVQLGTLGAQGRSSRLGTRHSMGSWMVAGVPRRSEKRPVQRSSLWPPRPAPSPRCSPRLPSA